MTSPYRVLQVARRVLQSEPFCLYDDPRYTKGAIARTVDGHPTMPHNATAVQFTATGAVGRAVFLLTEESFIERFVVFDDALYLLKRITYLDDRLFFNHCDHLGKDGCIALIDEVINVDR